ncbi:MAG: hypothetical protein ACLFQU_11320 [Candidatus Kapaibacterium sp.]
MDRFRNEYRISSARLQNWNYGWNASYFVTICTAYRECYFGDIVDDKMNLSEIGVIADKYWLKIPEHFTFVKLNVHVVMPNHVHGIIVIDKPDEGRNVIKDDERNVDRQVETPKLGTLPRNLHTNRKPPPHHKNGNPRH